MTWILTVLAVLFCGSVYLRIAAVTFEVLKRWDRKEWEERTKDHTFRGEYDENAMSAPGCVGAGVWPLLWLTLGVYVGLRFWILLVTPTREDVPEAKARRNK